ncbi:MULTISPECIES: carbonic anhydrase [unclassified Coleofasciculus]|uniref:carbonic anhydrase n=1 Tax=unclassified Coleofasciculus TaxID=2692782 RepID=UPI001882BBF6|nr:MULTISPECIES: carbonic anhydrase family protein [unclassified Coleofasciculus]MBE9127125.1 carbonic anhydrase family protein [Coleofasciculus sp. LEGE 07081]MBE9149768.1 carbonic anhydrase family protein [Coleofasciculus sp. LEGE 07092]
MKLTPNKLPVALTGIFASVVACVSAIPLGLLSDIKSSQASPDFTYGGSNNPTRWHELDPSWAVCESGTKQSPINLKESLLDLGGLLFSGNITFNYQPITNPLIQNNGHTIQVNYPFPSNSTMTIAGKTYRLVQFHFHTPSEHWLNDEAAAKELHLVHQDDQGKLAVVGVFIEPGSSNSELQTVLANMPLQEGSTMATGTINANNFLPPNKSYFTYNGSLTTPPCSEGVKWIVLKNPITASQAQIDSFTDLYQVNARPIQDLNLRNIDYRED